MAVSYLFTSLLTRKRDLSPAKMLFIYEKFSGITWRFWVGFHRVRAPSWLQSRWCSARHLFVILDYCRQVVLPFHASVLRMRIDRRLQVLHKYCECYMCGGHVAISTAQLKPVGTCENFCFESNSVNIRETEMRFVLALHRCYRCFGQKGGPTKFSAQQMFRPPTFYPQARHTRRTATASHCSRQRGRVECLQC